MRKPRCFVVSLLLATLGAPVAIPQALATPPASSSPAVKVLAFDVVSIKPVAPNSPPARGWVGVQYHPDSVEFASQSLPELLYFGFGYKSARFDGQISGLPAWTDTQRYDIVGKMSPADIAAFQNISEPQRQQAREQMVQSVLVDRFQLALHHGSKQVPVYELIVAKSGSKMKDAATDPNPPLGKPEDGVPHPGIRWQKETSIVQAYSMASWAQFLSSPNTGIGRPVFDKTGLAGIYTFPFNWSIYSAGISVRNGVAVNAGNEDGPSIFKALDEIGLKLQPSTAPMQTLIIDHVEQPTEN